VRLTGKSTQLFCQGTAPAGPFDEAAGANTGPDETTPDRSGVSTSIADEANGGRVKSKRDQARWVYLPEWLMEAIEQTCPFEDRTPERRVFQGVTEATAYQTMTRACQTAGVPHYHPHDLRHRRISLWHQSGVTARELADRAGHARPSMSLDVYSHVMPAGEVADERLLAVVSG
jgi:integrase